MKVPELPKKDLDKVRRAMNSDMVKQFPVRAPVSLRSKFELSCTFKNTSMNAVLNKAMEAYVNKYYDKALAALMVDQ